MIDFGVGIPENTGYQAKVEVHVIGEVRKSSLTPTLKPPVITIKRTPQKMEVYFDYDSAGLREEEKPRLLSVRGRVVVKGYASPEGGEEYNLNLSRRRAESVAEFLRKQGVRILRIKELGEKACRLNREEWSKCRKVEVIER